MWTASGSARGAQGFTVLLVTRREQLPQAIPEHTSEIGLGGPLALAKASGHRLPSFLRDGEMCADYPRLIPTKQSIPAPSLPIGK